ncbi:hypothetical protein C8J56DRAFT_1039106 [Mycena floridula]|nr:hypothetical protein C8J56DRAFT_1039106 [Mycena floridula]
MKDVLSYDGFLWINAPEMTLCLLIPSTKLRISSISTQPRIPQQTPRAGPQGEAHYENEPEYANAGYARDKKGVYPRHPRRRGYYDDYTGMGGLPNRGLMDLNPAPTPAIPIPMVVIQIPTAPPSSTTTPQAPLASRRIPLSKEDIEDIFLDLTQKFGVQKDSMQNSEYVGTLRNSSTLPPPG